MHLMRLKSYYNDSPFKLGNDIIEDVVTLKQIQKMELKPGLSSMMMKLSLFRIWGYQSILDKNVLI